MSRLIAPVALAALMSTAGLAQAEPREAPFNATLSNTVPLAFGLSAPAAARALGAPLTFVSGRPGNEIYLALRDVGGSGFFDRRDRLYLQFRGGRLTGWKGDWGRNWMWE